MQREESPIESLLRRHLPGLRRYVHRRTGGVVGARESSSDIVQSVCLELVERVADRRFELRGEAELKGWLYNAALYEIGNRRRFWSAGRRDAERDRPPVPHGSAGGEVDDELFPSFDSPSREAIAREELERLRLALRRLPGRQRRVVVLARLRGKTHREIAERLGITERASRMLLSRGLTRLHREVRPARPEDGPRPGERLRLRRCPAG